MLEQGRVPIVEDHLEELVREGQASGRLRFVVGAKEAVEGAEFVFLCVPTPQGPDGSADLSYVEAVAKEIAPALDARDGDREQVDGAGRLDAGRRPGARSP